MMYLRVPTLVLSIKNQDTLAATVMGSPLQKFYFNWDGLLVWYLIIFIWILYQVQKHVMQVYVILCCISPCAKYPLCETLLIPPKMSDH